MNLTTRIQRELGALILALTNGLRFVLIISSPNPGAFSTVSRCEAMVEQRSEAKPEPTHAQLQPGTGLELEPRAVLWI